MTFIPATILFCRGMASAKCFGPSTRKSVFLLPRALLHAGIWHQIVKKFRTVLSCRFRSINTYDLKFIPTSFHKQQTDLILLHFLAIVFLVLITFWLRPDSEMKLILNICAIITDTLILLYLGQTIPARVDNLPLIGKFLCKKSQVLR